MQISKSSFIIPLQLSLTIILSIHQFSISIFILLAPESIEFSNNSFTTETGLSTTSQAEIWFDNCLDNFIIFCIFLLIKNQFYKNNGLIKILYLQVFIFTRVFNPLLIFCILFS